jgi:predicted acylesterase/phospholipase RssA
MDVDDQLATDADTSRFMCATLVDRGETVLFRSYPTCDEDCKPQEVERKGLLARATIKQAARATSAAPTYLPEMCIEGLRFWDGGLLNNNPVDQVWDTRFDLAEKADETPVVSCVVSIGTSWCTKKRGSGFFNTISQAVSFATNTEAKHRDFDYNIRRMNLRLEPAEQTMYFRFNAPTGESEFNLDDWQQIGKLKKHTSKYLKLPGTVDKIDQCAHRLLR